MNQQASLRSLCHRHFSISAIEKGHRYHAQGRVLDANITTEGTSFSVHARVRGSNYQTYVVDVDFLPNSDGTYRIESECECPVGFNCKHAVAAIASALAELPLDADGGSAGQAAILKFQPPPETVEPLPSKPVTGMLDVWLNSLAPPPAAAKPAVGKVFVYVLSYEREQRKVQVGIARASRLKSGAWGKPANYTPAQPLSQWNPQPPPEDLRLLRLLIAEQSGYPRPPYSLEGASGAQLLREILDTGRCFWQEPDWSRPLKPGAARTASLDWSLQEDGCQLPAVAISPPADAVIPLDPPWYVDATRHECGTLTANWPASVLRRWLEGPAVMPEETGAAAKRVSALKLPAPRPIAVTRRRNVRPTPVLRLFHEETPESHRHYSARLHEDIASNDFASLAFDYGGHQVRWNELSESLRVLEKGDVQLIDRAIGLERGALRKLQDTPLVPLDSFYYYMGRDRAGLFTAESPQAWLTFVTNVVPELERQGWRIEFDPGFPYRLAKIDDWYSETTHSGNDWFNVELGIIVDGQRINLMPLLSNALAILEKQKRTGQPIDEADMRLPDGRIVQLPGDRLLAIGQTLAELHDPAALSGDRLQVSRLRAAEIIQFEGGGTWKAPDELRQLTDKLRGYERIETVAPPTMLNATLRPYQLDGLAWLQFLRAFNFAGILADDMGLGKTLQALAHIACEKEAGRADHPSLVIAPTSLMANWKSEAERFTPGLRVLVSHGLARKDYLDKLADYDLVVTSYSLLPRDEEILKKQPFHLVILDEAQYVKNPNTKWADVARTLSARHRLCMTGTPMENHLGELWSLMAFLAPGYLGTSQQFTRIYRTPIEKHGDGDRKAALARRLRPFILRRKKEEVATDLPPKTEITRTIELAGAQRDLYETIRLAMHERVKAEIARRGIAQSHIIILDALLKLRQVCCDPRLVKLERAKKVKDSAKLEFLRDMLPNLLDERRRILLFSQFTSMLDLIEPELGKLKIPFVRLSGDTSDRATPVKRFQSGEVPVFLVSLKAGGTGLNLTAADTVIHYDPWWNPAVEQQATDRAHRIGQDKPVFVYKLITQGTVEEKILALQARKRELVAGLLADGAAQNLQLSREDLDHLFDPVT